MNSVQSKVIKETGLPFTGQSPYFQPQGKGPGQALPPAAPPSLAVVLGAAPPRLDAAAALPVPLGRRLLLLCLWLCHRSLLSLGWCLPLFMRWPFRLRLLGRWLVLRSRLVLRLRFVLPQTLLNIVADMRHGNLAMPFVQVGSFQHILKRASRDSTS